MKKRLFYGSLFIFVLFITLISMKNISIGKTIKRNESPTEIKLDTTNTIMIEEVIVFGKKEVK
jgi:energy-converting hydrogenase Eha subunit H